MNTVHFKSRASANVTRRQQQKTKQSSTASAKT